MEFLNKLQTIETFVTMFSEYMNNSEVSIDDKKKFLLEHQNQISESLDTLNTIKEYILGNDDPDDDKYILDIDKLDSAICDTVDNFSKVIKEAESTKEDNKEETTEKATVVKSNKKRNAKNNLFTHTILMSNGDCFNLVAKTKKDLIDAITSVSNEDEGVVVEAVYKVSFEQIPFKKKVIYTLE